LGFKSVDIAITIEIRADNKGDGRSVWLDIDNHNVWKTTDINVKNNNWYSLTFRTTVPIDVFDNSSVFRIGFETERYAFSDAVWWFNTADITFSAV
ncbi:MAG: hypothetical protein LBQ27_02235, partial [Clostridiales bacterium]|nr:hypothetical protein [Clostridiales bacterium]